MPHTNRQGADRRRYERFDFRQPVKLHFFDDELLELSAIDISAGGVGVRSHFAFPANIACKIGIIIPITSGTLSFEVKSQLKHSIFRSNEDGFILGFSFTEMEPSLQTAIVCLMRGINEQKDAVIDVIARLGRHQT